MGWADERARLLAAEPAAIDAVLVPYPLPVRWGHSRGDIAVQDPFTGEWHEMAYDEATPVWKAALRRKSGNE